MGSLYGSVRSTRRGRNSEAKSSKRDNNINDLLRHPHRAEIQSIINECDDSIQTLEKEKQDFEEKNVINTDYRRLKKDALTLLQRWKESVGGGL